jgi:hypothetical protein
MPNYKALTLLCLVFLLLSAVAAPVFAATYAPGVTVGQYVKYGNFVGSGPGLEDFSNIGSQTLEVTKVAGTQVTLLSTGQYKNGTATQGNGTVSVWDVSAGTDNGVPDTQGPIIAANLNAGDPIPPPDTYSVNSTENRQYLGVTRSVNILSVSISTPDYNSTFNYVYDKASGMLLEASSQTNTQSDAGSVTSEYSYSVTETNLFASSPTPTPTNLSPSIQIEYLVILVIVVIAVAVMVVLILFRKRI